MAKYGFLGLGIMGKAMALNLVKAGHEVVVWNRSGDKCTPLVEAGATQGESPADVVKQCPTTIAIVSNPAASEAICFGPNGVLEGISEGKGYVEMSTIDRETSQRIEKAVQAKGGTYLEAPVSGSKKPAEDGNLIILAAGHRPLFDETLPAFEVMGKKSLFLGEVGQGAAMKLVVNMTMGAMFNAFAEGMALADRAGLSTTELLEVLDAGAMSNPMFRVKGPVMQNGEYPTAFPLKHTQKDMRLAILLGDALALSMPTAAAANESFKRAMDMGLGDQDFSSAYRAIGGTIKNK